MTMGEKILNMRKARGWSQEELADRVGVTRQAVSRWESGSAKPDADKIIAICDLFGVSADYLLRDSYCGEAGQTILAERKESELDKFFRELNMKQWCGAGLCLLGCLVQVGLWLIYFLSDTNYTYPDGNGSSYFRFDAFLRCEDVLEIWQVAQAAVVLGIVLMLWKKLARWNLLGRISDVVKKLIQKYKHCI